MRPLIVWGATGQAVVLAEFVSGLGFEIVAFVDADPAATSPLAGVPLIAAERFDAWRAAHPEPLAGAVAIGGARGRDRLAVAERLRAAALSLPSLVHPAAYVAGDAAIGEGSQILAGAVIAARARIGAVCIVNTRASVDHESSIGDGSHIAPGATLAGLVHVGTCAFVGTGAAVIPRCRIGDDAVVGAGAVVIEDVIAGSTVYGVPARARGSTGSSAK
jgi:sugar O-acyltransferase (sialic acid O-acetyltransferase NeuD family)